MRNARKTAESGFYHVVTKGEADKTLFFDDADRELYLEILRKVCKEHPLLLRAYCLMSNHTHLLIEDTEQALSDAMKQLNERYAWHFQQKTHRTGHVFKNRYWSEPVEDEAYLLCAMRYIHANPAAAGICKASAYPWSSAKDYLGRKGITDTDLMLDMLNGRDGFIAYSLQEPLRANPFPGSRLKQHQTTDELKNIACSIVGDPRSLHALAPEKRREVVRLMHQSGFSGAEIAEVSGLTRSTVYKDLKTTPAA